VWNFPNRDENKRLLNIKKQKQEEKKKKTKEKNKQ